MSAAAGRAVGAVDGAEALPFADAAAWQAWLDEHHDTAPDAWVLVAKKGSGVASVTITECLDGALTVGWIDGQRRSFDDRHYLQRYSPRRPTSSWSRVNVEKVEALVAAGRMRPAGLAAVQAAKDDGRWDAAYASQRTATVPPDLAEALAADERARAAFEGLDKTQRYALLLRLMKARTPRTRATQLRQVLATLAEPAAPAEPAGP